MAAAFEWAVGIEDTFVGQPSRPSGQVLDEYELIDHYRRWRTDLDLVASLGVRSMRYGVPWYRVNPAPGGWDWSWTDRVFEHLDRRGIAPIVDLVHYGTPLWLRALVRRARTIRRGWPSTRPARPNATARSPAAGRRSTSRS